LHNSCAFSARKYLTNSPSGPENRQAYRTAGNDHQPIPPLPKFWLVSVGKWMRYFPLLTTPTSEPVTLEFARSQRCTAGIPNPEALFNRASGRLAMGWPHRGRSEGRSRPRHRQQ